MTRVRSAATAFATITAFALLASTASSSPAAAFTNYCPTQSPTQCTPPPTFSGFTIDQCVTTTSGAFTLTGQTTNGRDASLIMNNCLAGSSGGPDAIYQFTVDTSGTYTVSVTTSSGDPIVGVFACGTITGNCVDAGGSGASETLNVALTAFTPYLLIVKQYSSTAVYFSVQVSKSTASFSPTTTRYPTPFPTPAPTRKDIGPMLAFGIATGVGGPFLLVMAGLAAVDGTASQVSKVDGAFTLFSTTYISNAIPWLTKEAHLNKPVHYRERRALSNARDVALAIFLVFIVALSVLGGGVACAGDPSMWENNCFIIQGMLYACFAASLVVAAATLAMPTWCVGDLRFDFLVLAFTVAAGGISMSLALSPDLSYAANFDLYQAALAMYILASVTNLLSFLFSLRLAGKNGRCVPLYWAVYFGKDDVAQALVRAGADRKIRNDKTGLTPHDLAKQLFPDKLQLIKDLEPPPFVEPVSKTTNTTTTTTTSTTTTTPHKSGPVAAAVVVARPAADSVSSVGSAADNPLFGAKNVDPTTKLWLTRRDQLKRFLRLNDPEAYRDDMDGVVKGMMEDYTFEEVVDMMRQKYPNAKLPRGWDDDVKNENEVGFAPSVAFVAGAGVGVGVGALGGAAAAATVTGAAGGMGSQLAHDAAMHLAANSVVAGLQTALDPSSAASALADVGIGSALDVAADAVLGQAAHTVAGTVAVEVAKQAASQAVSATVGDQAKSQAQDFAMQAVGAACVVS